MFKQGIETCVCMHECVRASVCQCVRACMHVCVCACVQCLLCACIIHIKYIFVHSN